MPFTPDNVYGILSIFFWTLTVIVSLKYVVLVLRADNNGEGGLVAMLALASQAVQGQARSCASVLLVVGIFGTSLFYGDGVITPAISVLSAVEGLEVISPTFKKCGDSDHAGHSVRPVRACKSAARPASASSSARSRWSGSRCIAVLGVSPDRDPPRDPVGASVPHYALLFMWDNPGTTFIILGAVVLCVTGAEALYADLGHFGKKPIRLAWFSVVMPCADAQLLRPGRAAAEQPGGGEEPVLHDGARLGAAAAGGAGHHWPR